MAGEAGPERVLRWQSAALIGGGVLACLGVALVLYARDGGTARGAGWWISGLAGGLLTASFAFPVDALCAPVS